MSTTIHPERCNDDSVQGNHAPVQVTRVEISERTLATIAFAASVAAIVCSGWAYHESAVAEREARMLQYYTLEMDAKLIAAGLKKPEESVASGMHKQEK